MFWWSGKGEVREYLKKVNENGKVRMPTHTLIIPVLVLILLLRFSSTASSNQVFSWTI